MRRRLAWEQEGTGKGGGREIWHREESSFDHFAIITPGGSLGSPIRLPLFPALPTAPALALELPSHNDIDLPDPITLPAEAPAQDLGSDGSRPARETTDDAEANGNMEEEGKGAGPAVEALPDIPAANAGGRSGDEDDVGHEDGVECMAPGEASGENPIGSPLMARRPPPIVLEGRSPADTVGRIRAGFVPEEGIEEMHMKGREKEVATFRLLLRKSGVHLVECRVQLLFFFRLRRDV